MKQLDKYTDEQGRSWRNIVADNGTEFNVRVMFDNDDCEEYIGSTSMAEELYSSYYFHEYNTEKYADAQQIDDIICFYVEDDELELSDEELAKVLAENCEDVFGKAE